MLSRGRLWRLDTQVLANLSSEMIVDLGVPGNGGALIESEVVPPRVTPAFTQ
jgi:hypothetical protein